jgi:hypothetical protein
MCTKISAPQIGGKEGGEFMKNKVEMGNIMR